MIWALAAAVAGYIVGAYGKGKTWNDGQREGIRRTLVLFRERGWIVGSLDDLEATRPQVPDLEDEFPPETWGHA